MMAFEFVKDCVSSLQILFILGTSRILVNEAAHKKNCLLKNDKYDL